MAKNLESAPVDPVLTLSNFRDRRVLFFWALELASIISFIVWLAVVSYISRVLAVDEPQPEKYIHIARPEDPYSTGNITSITATKISNHEAEILSKQFSVDVWFSLSFIVAADALMVVATFNRALIRHFHYAVAQRLMFLTSVLSYCALQLDRVRTDLLPGHPVGALFLSFGLYLLFSSALDRFENPVSSTRQCSRWGSLQQYSKDLRLSEVSWTYALFLSAAVTGFGILLTRITPSSWSALVPILHIIFESVFLNLMKTKRTPRYLVLCSPPFFATICVHWGVLPLAIEPRLSITPRTFVSLIMGSRLLLDGVLRTALRLRSELRWARNEVLISTPNLLTVCAGMLFLENIGVKVITYIKPIMVAAFFGLSNIWFLAIASYNVVIT